jgi:hypothetical protein
MRRKTTEECISAFIKVHGDKYDYSKVQYISSRIKVCIVCKKHGEFWQVPSGHLSGKGCLSCNSKVDLNYFINRAKLVHNNKYDYTKVSYIDYETKVCIICPIHGEFWQTPHSHIRGRVCIKCGYDMTGKRNSSSLESFIQKSIEVHGNKYSYDKTIYVNAISKVIIYCKIHGYFEQTPREHLVGCGCKRCGTIKVGKDLVMSIGDFINKANNIHGIGTYLYNKVIYRDVISKVCIICPKHGEFWQIAHSHVQGHGCPVCSASKGENSIRNYLSKNNIEFEYEYSFFDLKGPGGRPLEFDFYLPSKNILIEYDGAQHFKPVCFGGMSVEQAIENFKKSQERDIIKNKYCEDKKINLLRISYKEYKKIHDILNNKILMD